MKKRGKGKKMDQAADNQIGLDQAAESLPRDQPKRTIPRTESADNTSPHNQPESSRLVWSAAGVYCGRRQSADSRPRGRVLMGQTADHGRRLEPSAVDAKTSSPICLSAHFTHYLPYRPTTAGSENDHAPPYRTLRSNSLPLDHLVPVVSREQTCL
uniref:Uncharacterized protein n=1 Tax=Brassica oleracea TaxID=3712 RepID=A0A3P6FXP0_BRAOL|nr:unnamed protein product [Brassica oleracea]